MFVPLIERKRGILDRLIEAYGPGAALSRQHPCQRVPQTIENNNWKEIAPMSDMQRMTIQLPAYIRYLALLPAVVAALPSLVGCIYFALNPDELAKNPWSLAFVIPLSIIPTWLGWRFFHMQGSADRDAVELYGMWRTLRIPTANLRSLESYSWQNHRDETVTGHILHGHDGQSLGTIPPLLCGVSGYDKFIGHLRKLAEFARREYGDNFPPLEPIEKPVAEWTAEDFDRYEDSDD